MKMFPAFHKFALSLLLAMAGLLSFAPAASAQACTVTVSITTAGTSDACFVPRNAPAYVTVTGTWVGTAPINVTVQRSDDGAASWQTEEMTTVNELVTLGPRRNDARYRVTAVLASGTVTGQIVYNPLIVSRLKYSTVPIGSVAYGSFGVSVITSATSSGAIDLFVDQAFRSTGCGLMIGGTGGTDSLICSLYDAKGLLVANTAAAGVTASASTNAFQEIAWTSAVTLPAGRYYLVFQSNGTTVTIRRPAALTFVNIVTSSITSVFGTIPSVIAVPSTMATSIAAGGTNAIGAISYIY